MHPRIANRPSLAERAAYLMSRARGVNIETNLNPYLSQLYTIRAQRLSARSDLELAGLAAELRLRAAAGESLGALLVPTYALVAEASARALGLPPYDEQILAAIVLHSGKLAQMQTGEGKTLAAVFPAALNALAGRGVHVMTANDYLARRDARWMGPVFGFLGLTVGYVQERMSVPDRKAAYESDVTYVTAREAGFDLLRDELRYRREDLVHRGFSFAIVDEADFLLIDEARIPLVIAGASELAEVDPRRIDAVVPALVPEEDYLIDRGRRRVSLTVEGQDKVQELCGCGGMHEEGSRQVYAAVTVALHAHHLLARDVDYIVRAGRIDLVDELTGRVAYKRRWPYGVQSALEAKEGLELQPEGRVYGSITIQHFVTLYPRIAGLTATAVSAATELSGFYGLGTVIIPPHRPVIRVDAPDRVFSTEAAKSAAIVEEIRTVHAAGRPVLVGTTSVKASQELADRLEARGIRCEVLNARDDGREAELVARAGMLGAVTVSTNMAGRGTDIMLGGEEGVGRERIRELGGLYVLGTNRHESVRIDNQLRGRAGRQGDPGISRFFVSLEDQIVERYAITELIPAQHPGGEAGLEIHDPRVSREIARAQGIIETQNHDLRRTLRRYSEIVEGHRRLVQERRRCALVDGMVPDELWKRCSAHHGELAVVLGEEKAGEILSRSYLACLDQFWADQLLLVDDVKEGASLQRYAGEDPLLHFIREVDDAFREGMGEAEERAAIRFHAIDADRGVREPFGAVLSGPAGTWTYLVSEDPLPGFRLSLIGAGSTGVAAVAAALAAIPLVVAAPFIGLAALARRLVARGNRARRSGPV